ncbi:MAG: L-ribulose-5-phosphate 4-epimerase AraD [Coprobacillus sp.]|nr:L-ribulose-5-phosphate 4-epimerase AraD [Coprobacillus sp.]
MLEELKREVLEANKSLGEHGLVTLTWGNCSAYDKDSGYVVIKPSGVPYADLTIKDMVVIDLDGKVIEGSLKPSSDTPTHLYIYKHFKKITAVVHTHSTFACAWAQAGKDLPVYGTTHADSFHGSVPCTRQLTPEEVKTDYELNTGKVIVETFKSRDYLVTPGCFVRSHGPFVWGQTLKEAVENAIVLELISHMGVATLSINKDAETLPKHIIDKHYYRKHGVNAYYGQDKGVLEASHIEKKTRKRGK